MEKGYIQIYTGDGKGKSTAALGLALRAAGAGLRSLLIQFMKRGFPYSELNVIGRSSEWMKVEQYGSDAHVLEKRQPTEAEKAAVQRGLARVVEEYERREFDIVILDEICVAVHFGLIGEMDVLPLLEQKPENIELVLTGRYCPESWLERADLVTEMKEIKHYYNKGVLSRKGIDS